MSSCYDDHILINTYKFDIRSIHNEGIPESSSILSLASPSVFNLIISTHICFFRIRVDKGIREVILVLSWDGLDIKLAEYLTIF